MVIRIRLPRTPGVLSRSRAVANRRLTILALESSADDSCCAILRDQQILSSVVIKQNATHEAYGGIHPLEAAKLHQIQLPIAIQKALVESNVELSDLDAIAYTRGPGMMACLTVSAVAAKTLATVLEKPLLGVHHMVRSSCSFLFVTIAPGLTYLTFDIRQQAHALTPFLTEADPPRFPFLSILVSGGHTLLLLARDESSFKILATTGDESIG